MYPAGAYLVAHALHDELERSAQLRRRRDVATDGRTPTPQPRWSELLRFPRFRLADARG